jgi:hypothetical protein
MTKKVLLLLTLLFCAFTAFAATAPEMGAQSPAAAPAVTEAPALDLAPAGTCPGTATKAGDATPEWLAASSCCRPQCSVDSDCNRICGAGLGVCRLVNSCCRACLCSAASAL